MIRCAHATAAFGFSLVELTLAMAVSLAVVAAVFGLLNPANGAFQVQPESADVEQRLRAATAALERDLTVAGAAPWIAPFVGIADRRVIPGVLPYRVGRRSPDPAGSFVASRISVMRVERGPQTTLAAPLAASSGAAQVSIGPGCRAGDASCGFRPTMSVIVYDGSGAWDLFSVTAVSGDWLTLQHDTVDSPKVYSPATSTIAVASSRTYFLKEDAAANAPQLTRYEGGGGADVPVVSHVVSLTFEYFGEAEAPAVLAAPGLPIRTSYGPPPPDATQQPTTYPPGENCAFWRTAEGALMPRLPALAASPVLVPLSAGDLTDGPWCPDALSPSRYDADLLRIRLVAVRLRVQSAVASLRGPAGPLFTRGGTAHGSRLVPDREVAFLVAPRALNAVR